MRNSEYLDLEKLIMKADSGTIVQRWRYGRRLLMDGTATLPNGRLRHGVTAQLILLARGAGYKLSETELQRRLQCANAYDTEAQIQAIIAEFDSWSALRDANFPKPNSPRRGGSYPTVGEGNAGQAADDSSGAEDGYGYEDDLRERPYDPRTTDEIIRDHEARGRRLLAVTWEPGAEQLALFKPDKLDAESTLLDLKKYADEQHELTARFQAIDEKRYTYLSRLINAVGGDMTRTWREAEAALAAQEETDEHDGVPD